MSPAPSATGGLTPNGEATKTSMNAKKTATPPSTGTVHGSRSRALRRVNRTAPAEQPVRMRSQRSSEPSWPPQNAESE